MGFFFRKSFGSGPFRVNLSRSGIGYSFGIKGARISTGPRGTYISAGSHGFYYRQKVGGASGNHQPVINPAPKGNIQPYVGDSLYTIQSADICQLVDVSSESVITTINNRLKEPNKAPLIFGGSFVIFILLLFFSIPLLLSFGILGLGIIWGYKAREKDIANKTSNFFYELEEPIRSQYEKREQSLEILGRSNNLWRITTSQPTSEWKKHAGASNLINRKKVLMIQSRPPYINTNLNEKGLDLGDIKVYFLPDFLYVYQQGQYGALTYDSISVTCNPTQFVETEGVPSDSQLIRYTWLYPNKDGGPDRRYSNNKQIPIVKYGEIEIKSPSGLNIRLNVSSFEIANKFVELMTKARMELGKE